MSAGFGHLPLPTLEDTPVDDSSTVGREGTESVSQDQMLDQTLTPQGVQGTIPAPTVASPQMHPSAGQIPPELQQRIAGLQGAVQQLVESNRMLQAEQVATRAQLFEESIRDLDPEEQDAARQRFYEEQQLREARTRLGHWLQSVAEKEQFLEEVGRHYAARELSNATGAPVEWLLQFTDPNQMLINAQIYAAQFGRHRAAVGQHVPTPPAAMPGGVPTQPRYVAPYQTSQPVTPRFESGLTATPGRRPEPETLDDAAAAFARAALPR